jgi:hypothetical protein
MRSEVAFEPLYFQLLGGQLWSSVANRSAAGTSHDANRMNGDRPVVTAVDVRTLVDFDQAIEVFYNSTVSQVCAYRQVPEKATRDWIDSELVTPDETRSMVRRQANETEGLNTNVLDDLIADGLLRTEPRGDDLWVELAHDQLVERVREFNRIWWTKRTHTSLLDGGTRFLVAMNACMPDMQRWSASRTLLWTTATGIRESGIQLSRWYGRWSPFTRHSNQEIDRLAIRAFVLVGTLINSAVYLYRSQMAPSAPGTVNEIEGLDPETAKRRLRATALNLGGTDQVLAAINLLAAFGWTRLLSRLLPSTKIKASKKDRRRLYTGILICADISLSLLRGAVRYGLIKNCLNDAEPVQLSRASRGERVDMVRRCRSLKEAASLSRDNPVLLVLDWRSEVDGTGEFKRFLDREVPLYEGDLRLRGATVAWCCHADVRRRGWRDGVSGIGFPWRGQRIYYMLERGSVVAWRAVKSYEYPVLLQGGASEDQSDWSRVAKQQAETAKRFRAILTALIVSSEAAPSFYHDLGDLYLNSGLRRRSH